jgi:hypothetical protein
MLRNYLAAALRNLARNRFYSGLSIASLAIGLCAALLTGLVIRNQLSYDHFIRGYERTYLAGFRSGGAAARQSLVALQFAILIGLLIAAAVVYQQRRFATQDALRIKADQILIIRSACNASFETEIRALPGVLRAFCSADSLLTGTAFGNYRLRDGSPQAIGMVGVERNAAPGRLASARRWVRAPVTSCAS